MFDARQSIDPIIHFPMVMPPPRGWSRCGGGFVFAFATAIAPGRLSHPATREKRAMEIESSTRARRHHWRPAATGRTTPAAWHCRANAATAGFSIYRTQSPARPETAVRTEAPIQIAFRARTGLARFVFLSSFFSFFLSAALVSGKFVKQKTHDCFGNRGF